MGAELDTDEVSAKLALEPTEAHRRGDPRPAASGRKLSPYSEGLWSLTLEQEGDSLVRLLDQVCEMLQPKKAQLEALRKRGLRQDLFIGLFGEDGNIGATIPAELQRKLANLSLPLEFDIYAG